MCLEHIPIKRKPWATRERLITAPPNVLETLKEGRIFGSEKLSRNSSRHGATRLRKVLIKVKYVN